ncbi:hypothetical protein FBZ92_108137 [Nitrospirillum viridazoti]|uniref:Uncharacterized protein n=1 Tax=Nitrospirillum amazonense TaxID=28077 RepID=A0A560IMA9_9PROT|nr:hypothetical protein FBZ92_108137 [Nitrospirillum amazonense]
MCRAQSPSLDRYAYPDTIASRILWHKGANPAFETWSP